MTVIAEAQSHAQPKIQAVNIANVLAYAFNLVVTYGVMASDRFPSNAEVSDKYFTLVTPAGYAFGIWGLIFTSELVWTIAQLLPAYRANALVVHGVSFYYVAVCLAQAAWTFSFTAERIVLSLVAMLATFLPLLLIANRLTKIAHRSLKDFWLLKFPFLTHFAWILAATFVNINVVLVSEKTSADVQFAAALTSFVCLAAGAFYFAFEKAYVVPSVVVWAAFAVRVALDHATVDFIAFHGAKHVDIVKNGAGLLAFVSALAVVLAVFQERYFRATHHGHRNTARTSRTTIDTSNENSGEYTQLND